MTDFVIEWCNLQGRSGVQRVTFATSVSKLCCNRLILRMLWGALPEAPFGLSLAQSSPGSPQEAGMFIWIVILAMAGVGGYWVKTRRQRKTKAATYAGN
jgi:hypothetical protein